MIRAFLGVLFAAWAAAAQAQNPYGFSHTQTPGATDNSYLVPNTAWVQSLLAAKYLPLTGGTLSGNLSVGGAATLPTINSASSSEAVTFKNGPSGSVMLQVGGTAVAVSPNVPLQLKPGWVWDSGTYNTAPISQNATFTGSTTAASAAFGLFLEQTDRSSNTGAMGSNGSFGLVEWLTLDGPGVTGHRRAGQFKLDVKSTTANTGFEAYVGLGGACNLLATDGSGQSSCIAMNPSATVAPGVTAAGIAGMEVNTQVDPSATVLQRIGFHVVDVIGLNGAGYGGYGTQDDVGIDIDNQYEPTSTLGFRVGQSFGRYGGHFPIIPTGTMIAAQGNNGGGFTVGNGIDWGLGTASGNWLNFGSVYQVTGDGFALPSLDGTVTATGTNRGTAYAVKAQRTVVTSAAAGTGVLLLSCAVRLYHGVVINAAALPITLYASGTQTINGIAGSTGVTVVAGGVSNWTCNTSSTVQSR